MYRIKGEKITRKDELTAIVDIFGVECKVHMRSFQIGGNTVEPLSMENPSITMRGCIEYPNGKFELVDLIIRTDAKTLGVMTFEGDDMRKWWVAEVCGEHIVEVTEII